MLALVAARLSRSLGPVGLILTIVLVIVLLKLARDLLQARFRGPGPDRQRATKNVTPQEGWLRPGDVPAPGPPWRNTAACKIDRMISLSHKGRATMQF